MTVRVMPRRGQWDIVVAVVLLVVAVILAVAACGSSPAGAADQNRAVPATGQWHNIGGDPGYNFPYVEFTCHGNVGVYISQISNGGTGGGGDITVEPADPNCS